MHLRAVRLIAALLAVVLTSCQMSVAVDVAVARDGGGTLELVIELDRELPELLDRAGVALRAGLEEAVAAAADWDVAVSDTDAGGLRFEATTTFADPEDFARLTDEFHVALDDEDARLFRRLRLERDDSGAVAFTGQVGLELPAAPGARGIGVAFDADDLERVLAERGDELVRYDLRVTFPGVPEAGHDADAVDGNSLTWRVPVGEQRNVQARSLPPPRPQWLVLTAVALLSAVTMALLVVVVRVRVRARR